MRYKKWRLLGAITAAMFIIAGSTFGKGNAPNATANAPDTTAIVQTSTGSSMEVVSQNDNDAIATLQPAITEGGALAGTELASAIVRLDGEASLLIAITTDAAGQMKYGHDATTFTKGVRGDAIFHLTITTVNTATLANKTAIPNEEALYDAIYEILAPAACAATTLTG